MFFRKFVILIWIFTRLLVPLAAPKVLPFERKNKKLLFLFCSLLTYSYLCTRIEAQMAESVDALVSNTSGATRAGSTPALGTSKSRKKLRTSNLRDFSYTQQKNQTVDFRKTSANALIVPRLWSTISVQKA